MGLTVSRQTAKTLTVNRQKGQFLPSTVRQRKQLSLAAKQFEGLSNLTISALHVGLLALKESFYWHN